MIPSALLDRRLAFDNGGVTSTGCERSAASRGARTVMTPSATSTVTFSASSAAGR